MSKGPKQPLDPATVAQLVAVTLRLAMEVSVLRGRLRSHELLLAQHGLLTPQGVDGFMVPAEEQAARDQATRALIEALAQDLS
jgi:hypothetical protein